MRGPWTSAWAGLAALAVAMGIGRFAFTPILPMMQDDFALTIAQAGWLASANYTGYLAGALSAISPRLRAGARSAPGWWSSACRPSRWACGSRTCRGSLCALRPGSRAHGSGIVSAWALERLAALGRSDLSGVVYAGVGTGIVIAGGVCVVAMELNTGSAPACSRWDPVDLVTAVIWPLVKGGQRQPLSAPPAAAPGIARAEYWRLVLCYGAYGFGYIIPATFSPRWRRRSCLIRGCSAGRGPCLAPRRSLRRSVRRR